MEMDNLDDPQSTRQFRTASFQKELIAWRTDDLAHWVLFSFGNSVHTSITTCHHQPDLLPTIPFAGPELIHNDTEPPPPAGTLRLPQRDGQIKMMATLLRQGQQECISSKTAAGVHLPPTNSKRAKKRNPNEMHH